MNAVHFHLVINHIPILATFFSIAVMIWGLWKKDESIQKVALAGFLIAGLFVIAAYQSGDAAEDLVENIPAVSHDRIEAHEEAAETAQWLTIVLGGGGVIGLLMLSKRFKRVNQYLYQYLWILLIYSLVTGASLAYTAYQGGFIRHPEIEETNELNESSLLRESKQGSDLNLSHLSPANI